MSSTKRHLLARPAHGGVIEHAVLSFAGLEHIGRLMCASRGWRDAVLRYLGQLLFSAGKIGAKEAAKVLQKYRYWFAREVIKFPRLKTTDDLLALKPFPGPFSFFVGQEVQNMKPTWNNLLIRLAGDRFFFTREPIDLDRSASLSSFNNHILLNDVKKIHSGSTKLVYISQQGRLYTRFLHKDSASEEIEIKAGELAQFFNDNFSQVVDFFVNELFMAIRSAENNIYLVINFNEVKESDLLFPDRLLFFKVEANEPLSSMTICRGSLYLLTAQGQPLELKLSQNDLNNRLDCFRGNKAKVWLLLTPRLLNLFPKYHISRTFQSGQLIAFEAVCDVKPLEKFTVEESIDFFRDSGMKGFDKVLLHNKIDGRKLAQMDQQAIENLFLPVDRTHTACRILEAINHRRGLRQQDPKLFVAGANPQNQFGLGDNLSNFIELNLPKFDINEQIADFVIGMHNCVLVTTFNRCFISVNCAREEEEIEIEERRRKLSGKGKRGNLNKPQDRRKPKRKPSREEKFLWLDLKSLAKKLIPWQRASLDLHFHQAKNAFQGFVFLCSTNQDKESLTFQSASDCLNFIRKTKNVNKHELHFLHGNSKAFFTYNDILHNETRLGFVSAIKWTPANRIVWSIQNKVLSSEEF